MSLKVSVRMPENKRIYEDPLVEVTKREDLNLLSKIFGLLHWREVVVSSKVSKDWKEVADRDPRYMISAHLIAFANQANRPLPVMHYKNLVVFEHDLRKKLHEAGQRQVQRLAFVSLSEKEGILKIETDDARLFFKTRYYRLSMEMLTLFLRSKCSDHDQWDALMINFANKITANFQCHHDAFPVNERVLNNWLNCEQVKKDAWIKENGIQDIFLLPRSVAIVEVNKFEIEYKVEYSEKKLVFIIVYDQAKCSNIATAISSLLASKKEQRGLKCAQLLRLFATSITFKVQYPPNGYLVKFDQEIKNKLIAYCKESNVWNNLLLTIFKDINFRSIVKVILGELYGKPPVESGSIIVLDT